MFWWLGSVSSGAALLLLSRWALRVSQPREDLQLAQRIAERTVERVRSLWSILWRAYGPVTQDMRSAWEQLRTRYRGGAYGSEGT